ncbi:hypothetical protein QJS10_CPA08g00534 [Acorus calamus]|uniref:Uncharacterized protein n=1 Tax=Acorus calamus TaxID=4465 RepID=A0AAV9E9L4_ACOCL|nr:hypothetical protein QJS10_CPA08g00534 [Acorus calamus]
MLKKKDEEITNANTTVTTLKNHVFKLIKENFLWKKVAKDTTADVRTLKGELEQPKRARARKRAKARARHCSLEKP